MIVVRGTDKAGEFVTAKHDSEHFRGEPAHVANLQQTTFEFMTDAANDTITGD